jgi:hypothetical protein
MDSVCHPAAAIWENGVAGLVRTLKDPEALTAVLKHLRHEWQSFQLPVLVERFKDFFLGPDFDPFAGAQFQTGRH